MAFWFLGKKNNEEIRKLKSDLKYSFSNIKKDMDSVNKIVHTPAQKRVIQLLMIAETPLEYEDIAKELKLNIITVRRHINDVKRLGFEIVERINTESNRKVFYIEKEVKKMIRAKK